MDNPTNNQAPYFGLFGETIRRSHLEQEYVSSNLIVVPNHFLLRWFFGYFLIPFLGVLALFSYCVCRAGQQVVAMSNGPAYLVCRLIGQLIYRAGRGSCLTAG